MYTQIIYRVLLLLPPIDSQSNQGGALILEESTTDPGYKKGDSFRVTKKVGIETPTSLENQEFTFLVTVLEPKFHYDGNTKFVHIMVESPDRTITKAYTDALKVLNSRYSVY
ncbi:MAG: hypothetical protein KME59_25010 [Trichormus sp. ATA11-4-KO1]|nr:hypothetical protein [Trichormus sp. ATA11-4-KO1]